MKTLEEKLSMFYNLAFSAAMEEKNKIIDEAQKLYNDKKQEAINAAKEQSVAFVRSEFEMTKKKYNALILKEQQEIKNHIFKIRENMIDEVFEKVKSMLLDFVDSDLYEEYLFKCIDECAREVGSKAVLITISQKDYERFKNDIISRHPDAVLESGEDIMGGCIVFNESRGTLSDRTFKAKLEEHRNDFLSVCKLVIT